MSREQEYRINELESEVRTLKAEVERLKTSLSIYNETNFSKVDLGNCVVDVQELPGNIAPQAGDSFDDDYILRGK